MEVNKQELQTIQGGGINLGLFVIGGGIISFVIGIVDGFIRPLKCNK